MQHSKYDIQRGPGATSQFYAAVMFCGRTVISVDFDRSILGYLKLK